MTRPRLALLFLCLPLFGLVLPAQAALVDWWSPQRNYRVSIAVNADGFSRTEKPAEVTVNFTTLLSNAGVTGAFNINSLWVVEVDDTGVIDTQVPFQFDVGANYNASNNAAGTLVILLTGTTNANSERLYHVYFDLQNKSFTAPTFTDQVVVSTVTDEGQSSFQVKTDNATYFYQKEAGGFSSLHDTDNNDWLDYHPTPASSPSSSFRGIPNMVHPEGKLHPGASGHTTTLMRSGPLKETIHTQVDTDGDSTHRWDVTWEFFPTYARMTVNDFEHSYWFLYEGTPGGDLETASDFVVRSNGTSNLTSSSWISDLAGEEWVYFADPNVDRSLYLINHAEDTLIDSYRPMGDSNGDMTVFGFGRDRQEKLLNQTPAYFTIGLMDTTAYANAAAIVRGAYKPLTVEHGSLEVQPSGGDTTPPVISNVQATVITTSSAKISWTTNETSNSVVTYGLTTGYGSNASSAQRVTLHSINLTGLSPDTTYHYRTHSTDVSGNIDSSGDFTFATLAENPDVSPIFKLTVPEFFRQKTPDQIRWQVPDGFDPTRKAFFHYSKDGVKWKLLKKITMAKEGFTWKPGKKRITDNGKLRMCAKPEKGKSVERVCEIVSNIRVLSRTAPAP